MKNRKFVLTAAVIVLLACTAAQAQDNAAASKGKTPGEIAAASRKLAAKNEHCRAGAKMRKLGFLKRRQFVRNCLKSPAG